MYEKEKKTKSDSKRIAKGRGKWKIRDRQVMQVCHSLRNKQRDCDRKSSRVSDGKREWETDRRSEWQE